MHRNLTRLWLVVLVGLSSTLVVASPAGADPVKPLACDDTGWYWGVSGLKPRHIGTGIIFKNGPGPGTVTASVQYGLKASLAVKIEGSVEGSVIVATAKASGAVTGTIEAHFQQTHGVSYPIPAGKYLNVQFGNWGWKSALSHYYVGNVNGQCKVY